MGLQYSHFTLEEFVGDLSSRDPKSLETLGFVKMNGQDAREISIAISRPTAAVNHDPAQGDSREICWVSVDTNLPVRIAEESYESGVWRTTSQIDFEFNQKLPPALFDPATLGH